MRHETFDELVTRIRKANARLSTKSRHDIANGDTELDQRALVEQDLRQVIAELSLLSHVAAASTGTSTRDAGESIGGKRPPGGIDRREDRQRAEIGVTKDDQPDRILRSAEHYRRRAERAHSLHTLEQILSEARASLTAWRRQPSSADKAHPMPGDFNWKRWVAESSLPSSEIARKCSVSKRYVNRVRAIYREAA
jgi:hypothetical protein